MKNSNKMNIMLDLLNSGKIQGALFVFDSLSDLEKRRAFEICASGVFPEKQIDESRALQFIELGGYMIDLSKVAYITDVHDCAPFNSSSIFRFGIKIFNSNELIFVTSRILHHSSNKFDIEKEEVLAALELLKNQFCDALYKFNASSSEKISGRLEAEANMYQFNVTAKSPEK